MRRLNLSPSRVKTRRTCQTECRISPRHALRRSGWLAFGPRTRCLFIYPVVYPSTFTNRILGAVYTECRDGVLFQCLGVVTHSPPSGEQEPCCYIMTTSWLTGIKPLCLAEPAITMESSAPCVLVTPIMSCSFAYSRVSSWRSLCWMEETVRPWSNWGVLPPFPLCWRCNTLFRQLLRTEADSFRGTDLKEPEAHIWLSRKCWQSSI